MDELELLKKDWNKSNPDFKQVSPKEIYSMLLKKSSSIVKTLFYISLAELIFWIAMNLVPLFASKEFQQEMVEIYDNHELFLSVLTIISIVIILTFIFLLYKSYKSISITDNAKKLMEKILNTRKLVKYYVLCNLALIAINFVFTLKITVSENEELSSQLNLASTPEMLWFMGKVILFLIIFLSIFWLFYMLIYGILVKRLNKNYKELKKMEV
jgi:hypothetical protein